MHYEINVSLDGQHLFGTHERSLTDETKAKRVYALFCHKFPAKDGYGVTLTKYETTGEIIAENRA